eukprot:5978802-Prymnesium_polylepis.3
MKNSSDLNRGRRPELKSKSDECKTSGALFAPYGSRTPCGLDPQRSNAARVTASWGAPPVLTVISLGDSAFVVQAPTSPSSFMHSIPTEYAQQRVILPL